MSARRRLALAGGIFAAAVGLAGAVRPSLLAGASLGEWAVTLLGAAAVLYAGLPMYRRRTSERHYGAAPDPETAATPSHPGERVERLLAVAGTTNPRTVDRRHRLRRRLTETAVAAVRRREDCDAEAAREMLAEGSWTDDPVAASYFTDGPVDLGGADLPLSLRVRLRMSWRSRRAYAARRAADEVAALTAPEGRR